MNAPTDDDRIRQHADLVYRTCLRITGNAQDAADVAQEVFVAWLRQHREIRGSVAAWLYGTARQRSLDWLRANHRRDRHEQQAALPVTAGASEDDWRIHLDEALNELPGTARTLVIEHHLLGLTQGQLAARYRCTQATISRRLTQTMDLLRSALRSRGVTASGAALLAGFTAAPATACPAPLVAPVLAQAQVVGTSALVGSIVVGGIGLVGWMAIAAGFLGLLTVVSGVGVWWWSTNVARDLDRDWTAVAMAHLPPLSASALTLPMPETSPRYPSIEALIARQRPLDVARQSRLEQLITPAGQAPWSLIDERMMTALTGLVTKLKAGEALKPDETDVVQRWRAFLRPILAELHQGEAALGAGTALAKAYADGRLGSNEQRGAWLHSRTGGEQAIGHRIVSLLIHAASQAADPRSELADLDVWVVSYSRAAITIFEALQAQALWEMRDRFYQELAWRGRLPSDLQQRWLAESCPIAALMSDALMGEALLMLIPHLDDLRAGRTADQGVLAHLSYVTQGPAITWIPQHLDIIQAALAGQDAERFRALDANAHSTVGYTYWPIVKAQADLVAISETRHRAHRLAVEILLRARSGEPLPEAWPTTAGRPVNAWGLHYERQSPTRFALVVDPDGGLPVCSLPESIEQIRSEVQEARSKTRTKPLVNQRLLIEMEVPPSPAAALASPIDPLPVDEPEPRFQSLAQ